MDMVKITLWVPDQKALQSVLSQARVHLDCGSPKRDADGNFIITLFAPKAQADKIAAVGYKHELDETYGDVLEERQKEVAKGDRFKGGTVKPEGLGVKR
jgi:hypothetical protein